MALSAPTYRIHARNLGLLDMFVDIDGQNGDTQFTETQLDNAVNAMAASLDAITGITVVEVFRYTITGTDIS